jgi:shikimate dehydrogenase
MRTYGLIGFPLGHSFSRKFFMDKFSIENKQEQYLNFELNNMDQLPMLIHNHPELVGFNVTIPYKEKILPYLDRIDQVAANVGAVNTVRILKENGRVILEGFNTDVFGFSESLRPLLKPDCKSALILGTGGASKAIRYSLDQLAIKWLLVSRNPGNDRTIGYNMITPELLQEYLIIINATPIGTFPHVENCPEIPYSCITNQHLLFDLVYNPSETRFLALGREQGAITKNGLEMLELQAIRSYEIWNREES